MKECEYLANIFRKIVAMRASDVTARIGAITSFGLKLEMETPLKLNIRESRRQHNKGCYHQPQTTEWK